MSHPHEEGVVVAALGSMTVALKAQRALLTAGLEATVVSLSPADTRRGCAYGVEFSAARESDARAALQGAHLSVSQYVRKGGGRL